MAVLGFFDADVLVHSPVPFNLELMKLASYYSSRRHVCVFLINPFVERYTRVFYRKDYNDGVFPKMLYKAENLSYGGHAFSGTRYAPLPEDIERAFPNPAMYERIRIPYANTKHDAEMYFNRYMYASHLRMSIDEENVFTDFDKYIDYEGRRTLIMFHDFNLGRVRDAHLVAKDLVEKKERGKITLGSKFPLQVSNIDTLQEWMKLPWSTRDFPVRYMGKMTDEEFVEMTNLFYKRKRHVRQLEIFIPGLAHSEQDFLENELVKFYRRMIYARENRFPIKLVVPPRYFTDRRWEDVIKLIEAYVSSGFLWRPIDEHEFNEGKAAPRTLYSFARNTRLEKNRTKYDIFSREEVRDIFKFVGENHYELFRQFYEVDNLELKGGRIIEK